MCNSGPLKSLTTAAHGLSSMQALEDCDVHGNRPLHLAARAGNTAVCESLLSWGAPSVVASNLCLCVGHLGCLSLDVHRYNDCVANC